MLHDRIRAGRVSSAIGAAAAIALSVLLIPALAVAGPPHAVGPVAVSGSENSSWASYPAGSARVVFPSTLPQIDLVDPSNVSKEAYLQVDGILELGAGGLPHPTVVAAAFPIQVAAFNATPAADPSVTPVGQFATLNVHSVGAALWTTTGIATYPGPLIGSATLFLNYTVLPSPSSGVLVGWNVVGWPWVASTDLLGLELHFGLIGASNLSSCTGATGSASAMPGTAACSGASIAGHGIAWDPTITSVVAKGEGGASASLGWAPKTTLASGSSTAVVVGTFAPTNTSAEVVLGTPAGGTPRLSGSLTFSLHMPAPPAVPALIRAAGLPYAIVLAASVALAGIGIALYRRRDRRIQEEI